MASTTHDAGRPSDRLQASIDTPLGRLRRQTQPSIGGQPLIGILRLLKILFITGHYKALEVAVCASEKRIPIADHDAQIGLATRLFICQLRSLLLACNPGYYEAPHLY